MGIMTNKAVNEIFGQPGDAIEGSNREGERDQHASRPTPAVGGDEFAVDPANDRHALFHLVEVFAPVSGDLPRVSGIDDHNIPLNCTALTTAASACDGADEVNPKALSHYRRITKG